MKKNITIQIDDQKLSALSMYLEQKNTNITSELEKQCDQLYSRVVSQNVRDFIDMQCRNRPGRKARAVVEVAAENMGGENASNKG